MTIEERLEALAQTVELPGHMQIQTEKNIDQTDKTMRALAEAHAETEKVVGRVAATRFDCSRL